MKIGILISVSFFIFSIVPFQGRSQSFLTKPLSLYEKRTSDVNLMTLKQPIAINDAIPTSNTFDVSKQTLSTNSLHSRLIAENCGNKLLLTGTSQSENSLIYQNQNNVTMKTSFFNSENYNKNRRLIYSSLWTFASLNYIYADLVQFMDKDEHLQYHTGNVNGFELTPGFIAASAAFMQVAIANVFLPQIIKNDRTLRWVQIASGAIMTLVQSATLFADRPTPYYAVFSGFEIAATAYITFDAIKWKPKRTLKDQSDLF